MKRTARPAAPPPTTLSYLLRLWRENDEHGPVWRVALKGAPAGEWLGFANLEALVEAVRQEVKQADEGDSPAIPGPGCARPH